MSSNRMKLGMKTAVHIGIPSLNRIEEVALDNVATIGDLLLKIAQILELDAARDLEHFGLTYAESSEGRQIWASAGDAAGAHAFHADHDGCYFFRVRRFPLTPTTSLSGNGRELLLLCIDFERTANHFGVHVHEDLHRRLAAYKMQTYRGRYEPSDHLPGYSLQLKLLPLDYPPEELERAERLIAAFHRDIQMMSGSEAAIEYLRAAYVAVGLTEVFFKVWKRHRLRSRPHAKALLGFGPHGLRVYVRCDADADDDAPFDCERTFRWTHLRAGDFSFKNGFCDGCSLVTIKDLEDKFVCHGDDVKAMQALFNEYLDSTCKHIGDVD